MGSFYSSPGVNPYLGRWMIFIDGENFTERGKRTMEREAIA